MQRVDLLPCFILHVRPYRDTSAIIDVLSEHHGRLSLVVKGLRGSGKSRQSWRAALQAFNLCALSWQGRGELKSLLDVQPLSRFSLSGEALYCGFYLNELLERTLHRYDPHPEVFHAYKTCLNALGELKLSDDPKLQMVACLRQFEFSLLEEIGYGLSLGWCADSGEAVQAERQYCYIPEQGLRPAQTHDEVVFAGSVLLALSDLDWAQPGALAAAKKLTQMSLQPLLGDKPLQSRRLFQEGMKL
ncbi:DNA repair protein RecO [Spongiibacter sp. KMU-158]|uniref:DNA repair protein RecO n=1 Tax=Spongiibacter pelagi TaxID=2760804 RepID=A0A927C2D4_9GAMM|nr:DNA repair protein RecO [Spongiibacter pelagi]MBD2858582.1 DNA repair protein RecO [Spongiibacter pelagi]